MGRRGIDWGGEGGITKVYEESFGPDGHWLYLDCGDDLMGAYLCQNLLNCTL